MGLVVGFASWNVKSFVKVWIFTGELYHPLPETLSPVVVKRSLEPLSAATPLKAIPALVKPPPYDEKKYR